MKSSCYSLAALLGALASGLIALGLGAGGALNREERSLAPRGALARHPRTTRLLARTSPSRARPERASSAQAAAAIVPTTKAPLGLLHNDAAYHDRLSSDNPGVAVPHGEPTWFVNAELATVAEPQAEVVGEQSPEPGESAGIALTADEDSRASVEVLASVLADVLADLPARAPSDQDESAWLEAESNALAAVEVATDEATDQVAVEEWEPLPFRVLGWDVDEDDDASESPVAISSTDTVEVSSDQVVSEDTLPQTKPSAEVLRQLGRSLISCGRWLETKATQWERPVTPCQ